MLESTLNFAFCSLLTSGRTGGSGGFIRNVAVDDLEESAMAVVAKKIEGLGFDRGRVHGLPEQVRALQLGMGRLLGFFGDRLDGRGAIDGFLGAGDVRQPVNRQSTW
jgi:hypothetical protein